MTASEEPVRDDRTVTGITEGEARSVTPLPLTRVGRYVIEGMLGAGGMAVVYLARDPALDRSVALKVIRADGDAQAVSRLLREGQSMARVSHPNVIHVYEVGRESEALVYIAMERIEGMTLDEWLRSPRSRRTILDTFADAGRGLAAAHAAGLVHRDFKPENVMVGNDGRVRVLDFGLARSSDGDDAIDLVRRDNGALTGATSVGTVIGTPAYMSPEQWRGERATVRTDQFSFCVSLARALTGDHPFELGSREELREAVIAGRTKKLPRSIPRRLRSVLRRGMAPVPDDRFSSIDAVVSAVAARTHWPWIAAAVGVLIVAGVVFGVLARPDSPTATIYAPPQRITSRGDVSRAAVSPDGTQLAVLTQDALIVQAMQPDATQRVLLRGFLARHTLSWSPVGDQIALIAGIAGSTAPPGLTVIDVHSGTVRRIAENLGHIALLGNDELVAGRYAGKQLAFYRLTDASRPIRTCDLPQPFVGIRALHFDPASDSIFVQLDHDDRESSIARIDRACSRIAIAAARVPALSFAVRAPDARIFVRLMSRRGLVEIGDDGQPTGLQHVIQSSDYDPLAILPSGRIAHLERSTRWQLVAIDLDGTRRELAGGAAESRFAVSVDGAQLAQVEGVYGRGLLRIGTLADLGGTLETIASGVSRVAWSPDGTRLAVLSRGDQGYEVATWNRVTRVMSPSRTVPIQYDGEMTWIDDRRIAFGRPHAWRGFSWIDAATGQVGELAVGDGEATMSLARARDGRLAYVTETANEIHVWTFAEGTQPARLAAVPVTSPRSSRKARVTWSADGTSLVLYDGYSGELWSIGRDGNHAPLLGFAMPRTGGFTELYDVLALPDRLVIETVTQSADVFVSRPLDQPTE